MVPLYTPEFNFLRPSWWFGRVDSRPISAFRIFFALMLLKDALYHLPISTQFYSDDGLMPLSALRTMARANRFSLMDSMPEPWMALAFFWLWVAVLVALLLGYQTRLMAVLNFLIILSVHERNIYVLNGADTVLRVLSFWLIFIPSGAYYSLDALRGRWRSYQVNRRLSSLRVPDTPHMTFAFPVRMMQIQFALIYVFTFILKLDGSTWSEGQAVHYALQVNSLTLPTGAWMLEHVPYFFLQTMTIFSLVSELLFLPLVFLPFFQPTLRAIGLTLVFMMHLGIGALMSIPNFSAVMPIGFLLLFLPEWIIGWDALLRSKRQPLSLPIPASRSPLWLLMAVTREDEISADTGQINQAAHPDGWAMFNLQGRAYIGVEAWRQAAGHLPLSRFWGWTLNFAPLRAALWRLSCFTIGRGMAAPEIEFEPIPKRSFPTFTLASRAVQVAGLGFIMFGVLWMNLRTIKQRGEYVFDPMPAFVNQVIYTSGLHQQWNMFAPYPSHRDGWITVPGKFEDGRTFDLLTREPLSTEWTQWYWGAAARWKKYSGTLRYEKHEALLQSMGSYYCDLYNKQDALPEGHRLATLEIIDNYRVSYAPGEEQNPLQTQVLWRHWCYPDYQY
jgi:hypothetical protein